MTDARAKLYSHSTKKDKNKSFTDFIENKTLTFGE